MRKYIVLIVILCLAKVSFAQLTGGIKAGINLANFIGSDAGDSEMIVGYNAGGFLQINLSERLYFQPELLMGMVGSKDSESGSDPDFGDYKLDAKLQLTYLSIPLLIGYNLNDRFSLHAGPQVSILTAAKAKYDIETEFFDTSGSENAKDQFKGVDLGVNFGLGVDVHPVNISVRYSLGLVNIFDDEDAGNVKNGVFQLSVGYKIEK